MIRNIVFLSCILFFVAIECRDREDMFRFGLPDNVEVMLTRDMFLQREAMRRERSMNRTMDAAKGSGNYSEDGNSTSEFQKRAANPNLTYRGGIVMTSATVKSIFWGTNWMYSAFHKDKLDSVDLFFNGLSNSNYIKTGVEYTGSNGRATTTLKYNGRWVDTTSSAATSEGGNNQYNALVNKICSIMTNQWNSLDANGMSYIPVFVDQPRPAGMGYCAWHSYAYCGSKRFQFGFHWNLDGDSACDPRDTQNLRSQGATAIVNVAGHEVLEAITDPMLNAWLDSNSYENADKCAWKFPTPFITLTNGAKFKVQAEWSNNAYNARNGFADSSGNRGCISGA